MVKSIAVIALLVFFSEIASAQDSRSVATNTSSSSTKKSFATSKVRSKAFKQHPYNVYYDKLVDQYEQRMKDNVKKYRVMERKMQKPQYTDPSYFGHKRKPKMRPVGKRKYCKECEIVH